MSENNQRWDILAARQNFKNYPFFTASGGLSFDILFNEVSNSGSSIHFVTALFVDSFNFFDESGGKIGFINFNVTITVDMTVNSINPLDLSGYIRFKYTLKTNKERIIENINFYIKKEADCIGENEFIQGSSDSFIPEKLRTLNFFQLVKKVSFFYSVLSIL